jgi:hypothetical protein
MPRQNTDLNYIEVGYFTPEEYYVYTANAESAQQVTSTMSCDAGKIVSAQSNLEVTTTTTCTISHIEGADLFAFSESQIQIIVDRIRDNNIAAITDSDLSSIVASIRSFESAEISDFDLSAVIGRSREFNLETQAAFSIVADGDKFSLQDTEASLVSQTTIITTADPIFRIINQTLESTTDISVVAEATKLFEASLDIDTDQATIVVATKSAIVSAESITVISADASRTRETSVSLISQSELSCTISHIEGADLQAFSDSVVTINATATKPFTANLQSITENVIAANKQTVSQASLQVISNLIAYPKILDDRTTFIAKTGNGYTDVRIVTDNKKFGQGSLYLPYSPSYGNSEIPYTIIDANSNRWITVGSTHYLISGGNTYTSTNGTSWTRTANNLGSITFPDQFQNVTHTGSQFVFIIPSGTASDVIYTSTDAITWTGTASTLSDSYQRSARIQFFNSYYYVIGRPSSGGGFRVFRTNQSNFTNWTTANTSTFGSGGTTIVGFEKTASELTIAGHTGGAGGPYPFAYRSTNGTTWTSFGPSLTAHTTLSYRLTNNNQTYVLITRRESDSVHFIFTGSVGGNISSTGTNLGSFNPYVAVNDGTRWLIQGLDTNDFKIRQGTSLGSLSTVYTHGNNNFGVGAKFSNITYFNSSWIFFEQDTIQTSTDGTTFTSYSLNVPTDSLPGYVEYTSLSNDFTDFKTIDFWVYFTAQGNDQLGGTISINDTISYNDNNLKINFQNGRATVTYQFIGQTSTEKSLFPASANSAGWYHVRITKDSGNVRLFWNGTLVDSDTYDGGGLLPSDSKVLFYNEYTDNVQIDEFLISDTLLTANNVNSFTVPTRQWDNVTNTDLLLHFNTDFYDDSRYPAVEQAILQSISVLSGTISGPVRVSADLQLISTLSAQGIKTTETILTGFGDSQVVTNGVRIRYFDSNLLSNTDASIIINRVIVSDASLASQTTQTTDAVKTVSAEVSMSGITISLTASARIRSGDIQANVESALTVDAIITAQGTANLVSESVLSNTGERIRYQDAGLVSQTQSQIDFGIIRQLESAQASDIDQTSIVNIIASAQSQMQGITISLTALGAIRTGLINMVVESTQTTIAVKTTDVIATVDSQTALTATGIIKVDFAADLVSTSALQSSGERIRFADSQQQSQTSVTIDANFIADFQASLASTSDISATPRGIVSVLAELVSTFEQITIPSRLRDQTLGLIAQSNIAISTNDSVTRTTDSQQSASTELTSTAGRIRPFDAALVANTIDLFVVAKIGAGFVNADVQSVLSADVNVIAVSASVLQIATDTNITAVKTTDVISTTNSDINLIAEGTTNIIGEATISTESILIAASSVTYSAAVNASIETDLAATARVLRGLAFLEQSSGTLTCDLGRIRQFTSNFSAVSIDLIIGQRVVSFNANLVSQSTLTAQGRDIDLAKYVYIVPNEVRTWTIAEENRTRVVKEETRIYKIRRY